MSTNLLRLIPTTPTYVPKPDAQAKACDLLWDLVPDAEGLEPLVYDQTRFMDQGENFDSLTCPECGNAIETAWWQNAMETAAESSFEELAVRTPCCSSETSLNDLKYDFPAGFARFVIEVTEPSLRDFIDQVRLAPIEAVLGTRVRQIFARY